MKTIRFTICLLGLIVGLSVLSFGQCQNQQCSLNTSTGCYQCVTGNGIACSPEVAACPKSCTDTACFCDPVTHICKIPAAGTLGSLQGIKLQPRLLDREFLASIMPASSPQCGSADLPKKVLFSI